MDERSVVTTSLLVAARFPRQCGIDEGPKYSDEAEDRKQGRAWITRVLTCSNINRVKEDLGVELQTFEDLKEKLAPYLCSSKWRYEDLDEVVGVFVHVLMKGGGFNSIKSKLGRSKSTISLYFWRCACAFFEKIYPEEICGLSEARGGHPHVTENPTFRWFGSVCGAGDGCLIPVQCYQEDAARMRCRKGFTARNVFAVADFNLYYLYCQLGGEGTANDPQILNKLLEDRLFSLSGNDRILLDAIYRYRDNMLTPYRGVRYHLKEWENSRLRPCNYRELYNLRHAQLRSCIERAFGYTKCKFRILQSPLPFHDHTKQILILYCIFGLHNFILRREGVQEQFIPSGGEDDEDEPSEFDFVNDEGTLRCEIAQKLWTDYELYWADQAQIPE
jgi:hypothetical protein